MRVLLTVLLLVLQFRPVLGVVLCLPTAKATAECGMSDHPGAAASRVDAPRGASALVAAGAQDRMACSTGEFCAPTMSGIAASTFAFTAVTQLAVVRRSAEHHPHVLDPTAPPLPPPIA